MSGCPAIVFVAALAWAPAAIAQVRPAILSVSIGEHYGTVYVAHPRLPVMVLVLRGEPVQLEVTLTTRADKTVLRVRPGAAAAFTARLVPTGPTPTPDAEILWDRPVRPSGGFYRRTPFDLPATLGRGEYARWVATIRQFESVPSGVYRFEVAPQFDRRYLPALAVNNDGIVIELRDVKTLNERLEWARIQATRAFANRELATTEMWARRMLAMYAHSGWAHVLLADAAANRGAMAEARAHYVKAIELLRSGGDALFLEANTAHTRGEILGNLTLRLTTLDRR